MLAAADHRRGRTIEERFARDVIGIIKGTPEDTEMLKKKQDIHKLGMVNRYVICSRFERLGLKMSRITEETHGRGYNVQHSSCQCMAPLSIGGMVLP